MTLDELRAAIAADSERFTKGIDWLREHDPDGSFYVWYKAGILPHHRMPAQSDDRREAYRTWLDAFKLWLALDARLLRLERQVAALTAAEGTAA